MPGNIRLWGTSGYVELAAPSTAANQVLTLPTDSVQPGMVLIASQSFSSVSSISFNNCFSSVYDNYRIIISVTNSTSCELSIRMRNSGVDRTDFAYANSVYGYTSENATTTDAYNQGTDRGIFLNTSVVALNTYCVDIFNPFVSTTHTPMVVSGSRQGLTANGIAFFGSVRYRVNNSNDGTTIYVTAGTMSGAIKIYGYRNS